MHSANSTPQRDVKKLKINKPDLPVNTDLRLDLDHDDDTDSDMPDQMISRSDREAITRSLLINAEAASGHDGTSPQSQAFSPGSSTTTNCTSLVKDTLDVLVPLLNKLIETAFEKVTTKIDKKLDPIQTMRDDLQQVQESLDQHKRPMKYMYELDGLEQYTRRDNIKIAGIAEDEGEDLAAKVMSIASDIGVPLSHQDLSAVHRVGKQKQGKPRPTICRFTSRMKKDDLVKNRKKLKDIPAYKATVFINEDLTTLRVIRQDAPQC